METLLYIFFGVFILLFFSSVLSYIINVQKTPRHKYDINKEKEYED